MTETKQATADAKKETEAKPINAGRLQGAEFSRTIYSAVPEHGTPYKAMLEPKYWAHVASKLRPRDRIEVEAEDGTFFAELLVQDVGRTWAKVAELRHVDLEKVEVGTEPSAMIEYEIKWAGPHHKFRVLRRADNSVIKDGFADKKAANTFLNQHIQAIAA